MAATKACKELLWLKRFLQELGFKQQRYAVLCDNQSAIHLAKNSMFHKRTKHIDIRYHWIRNAIEDSMFELNKIHTDDNASDMLTKAVTREKLKFSLKVPVVVRLERTNDQGKRILKAFITEESGMALITMEDLDDAAEKAVKALKST
ncbi:retrovirus-related pol polyprotein from transposon TNT 1-94 [Tanacetum coccineum]